MLNGFEQGIVADLRRKYGEHVAQYSDEIIYAAWKSFSQSDDYPDTKQDKFPAWCEN